MSTFNKPEITKERTEEIRRLIKENPDMGRRRLSIAQCEMWNWRGANGNVKNMSCRDLLRSLDRKGKIVLPPPMNKSRVAGEKPEIRHLEHDDTPITGTLNDVRPLQIEIVSLACLLCVG